MLHAVADTKAAVGRSKRRRAAQAARAAAWLTLCVCAFGSSAALSQAAGAGALPKRATIVPRVAHHQHLMSPMNIAGREAEPAFNAVELPPHLERLLRGREAAAGSSAPSDVFTENAQIVRFNQGNWIRGRAAIDAYNGSLVKNLRYRASAFDLGDATGHIAGTVRVGDSPEDVANFLLALKKGSDGAWRIAAENTSSKPPPDYPAPITADQLVAQMDDAGIGRGVVLSIAYSWASVFRTKPVDDEYGKVRAENDWTAQEAARHPGRLVAFCGVNPLRDYAVAEVQRCARLPQVKGMKLHFANSGVDVKNPEHVETLRRFFRAADAARLAMVVHVMPRGSDYGAEHSRIFLERILPEAPNVTVQIAHMAGSGPPYTSDAAMAAFAEAFEARDPRVKNVLVDVTGLNPSPAGAELMAKRIRQVGPSRVVFGSDMHPNPPPAAAWATFKRKVPLTDAELQVIADNVAPYLR